MTNDAQPYSRRRRGRNGTDVLDPSGRSQPFEDGEHRRPNCEVPSKGSAASGPRPGRRRSTTTYADPLSGLQNFPDRRSEGVGLRLVSVDGQSLSSGPDVVAGAARSG